MGKFLDSAVMTDFVRLAEMKQDKCDGNSAPANIFGLFMIALREKRGLTIEELADSSDVGIDAISRVECGEATFIETAYMIPSLAAELNVSSKILSKLLLSVTLG
jgi:hypothetical protein